MKGRKLNLKVLLVVGLVLLLEVGLFIGLWMPVLRNPNLLVEWANSGSDGPLRGFITSGLCPINEKVTFLESSFYASYKYGEPVYIYKGYLYYARGEVYYDTLIRYYPVPEEYPDSLREVVK